LNILLLGPQGSGKGTQAKRISAEYAIPHVATGDMFRSAIAAQTEVGRRVAPILAAAFHVKDIDYRWERGVRHVLAGRP